MNDVNRTVHEPGPEPRHTAREEEADADDAKRARAARDRSDEGDGPERDAATVRVHFGIGASVRARSTASSPRIPDARASGARITRCDSTTAATACTSSGMT